MERMDSERVPEVGDILARAALGRGQWLGEEQPPYDAIYRGANALIDLLNERGIRFAIAGGLAMRQLGEQRNTDDVDILIARGDLGRIPELAVISEESYFGHACFAGVQVDLLFTDQGLFAWVTRDFIETRSFGSRAVPCVTAEGMLLMKMFALPSLYRRGVTGKVGLHEADIRLLLDRFPIDAATAMERLGPHLRASDVEPLARIVRNIECSIERVRSRPFGEPVAGERPG